MQTSFDRFRDIAKKAVRIAADIAVQHSQEKHQTGKEDGTDVTVFDIACQIKIVELIREEFKDANIMAEETKIPKEMLPDLEKILNMEVGENSLDTGELDTKAEGVWVIDPIDGTSGFIEGLSYSHCVAYMTRKGVVLAAAIASPEIKGRTTPNGTLVYATKDGGAWMEDLKGFFKERIVLRAGMEKKYEPNKEELKEKNTLRDNIQKISGKKIACERGQCKVLSICLGASDVAFSYRNKVQSTWDHTCGALIIKEAGGVVNDVNGEKLVFPVDREMGENKGVVYAKNKDSMEAFLLAFKECCPECFSPKEPSCVPGDSQECVGGEMAERSKPSSGSKRRKLAK
ncbi:MAG: 3'(2'),5'-bisphosphate nucleotidase [Amphiamblys sp. WSBS2006]|nr:MAG: 3'(2'),5'-bisphosphate nucleotidase [Amphiamblys sp. WSBS2006]